ncbi:acyltransferase [Spirosoma sp. KNUC1025]|uniref:acyltransferase family protein n=1 Tax=Spirosoma sp. KNUC1025 TaxID=2894082 RepID=UPI00386CCB61|nr:acyltransferase [Spirosoma sp. KNUC1025]
MNLTTNALAGKSYVPALDGFRGLAILIVVVSHYGFGKWIPGGFGVTLFFFISGFLITRLLIAEHYKTQQIDLKGFYLRRVLRLYPALLMMVILAIGFSLSTGCGLQPGDILSTLFYYRNYYMLYGVDASAFACGRMFNITWSLAIEEHFYLFFPLLFIALYRWPKVLGSVMFLGIIGALAWRIQLITTEGLNEITMFKTYHFTETRLDAIMYGCLVSLILHHDRSERFLRLTISPVTLTIAVGMLLFTLLYRDDFFRETWRYSIQGVALSLILPAILYGKTYMSVKNWLSQPKLVLIGKFSYSLYLFHWVGVVVAERLVGGERLTATWLLTAVPLGLVLSVISYYGVEKPTARLRKRFGSTVETAPGLPEAHLSTKPTALR